MASKEKVKRKKAEKTPKLSFAKKKSKKSAKQLGMVSIINCSTFFLPGMW